MGLLAKIKSRIDGELANQIYTQLMEKFLLEIVDGIHEEPDPLKKGWKYHCFEEALLKNGYLMKPMPIDSDSEEGFGAPRHCYYNSQQVAFETELTYCEGYAIASADMPVPVCHAWVIHNNLAVELTWNKPGICYFGIPFNREWVKQLIEKRGSQEDIKVMTYDYLNSIELLKNGFPEVARAK